MFIYQDGKLYIQKGKKIVGVEIYPDKFVIVKGTETVQRDDCRVLNAFEMKAKFNIREDNPYIFPKEKEEIKEVIEDEPVKPVKKSAGRPKRK